VLFKKTKNCSPVFFIVCEVQNKSDSNCINILTLPEYLVILKASTSKGIILVLFLSVLLLDITMFFRSDKKKTCTLNMQGTDTVSYCPTEPSPNEVKDHVMLLPILRKQHNS